MHIIYFFIFFGFCNGCFEIEKKVVFYEVGVIKSKIQNFMILLHNYFDLSFISECIFDL